MVVHLDRLGLWFSVDRGSAWRTFQIFRMFLFAVDVFCWIFSAVLIGWKDFLSKAYSGIAIGSCYMVIQWFNLFMNAKYLENFLSGMEDVFIKKSEPKYKAIFDSIMEPTWKFVNLYTTYSVSVIVMGIFLPIIYGSLVVLWGGEPFFPSSLLEGLLPMRGGGLYWSVNWLSMFPGLVGIFFHAGMVSLMCLSVSCMRVSIQILCKDIQDWDLASSAHNDILLREIVRQHARIIKYVSFHIFHNL